jgi:DNA-binding transcriptional LysR family regulator
VAKLAFTLEQIRTFVAVADRGSMTRAAESLFLTQGAVTQQVRNFEQALGVQLVERMGGWIRLTSAGTSVAAACRAALKAIEQVNEAARSLASLEAGILQIGASPTAAAYYLPAILRRYSRRHPGVTVTVVTENTAHVAAAVVAGGLDCGLIEGPTEHPDLLEKVISSDRVLAVVRSDHALARMKIPDDRALVRHCYLGREPGASLELYADMILGSGYRRARRMQFGHLDAVHGAVMAGLGFAVLPQVAIADEVEQGLLVVLPWKPIVRPIKAIRRASIGASALEELWKMLPASARNVRWSTAGARQRRRV